jgi:hypothetical protein
MAMDPTTSGAGGAWFDAAPGQLAAGLEQFADQFPPGPASDRRALLLAAARRLARLAAQQHYVLRAMSWHEIMRGVEAHDPEAEGSILVDEMPRDPDGDIDLHAKLRVMVPVVSA